MLLSKSGSRGRARFRLCANEESPSSIGQGAGEIPVEATLRKVQQKYTATRSTCHAIPLWGRHVRRRYILRIYLSSKGGMAV